MACTSGAKSGGDQGAGGAWAGWRSRAERQRQRKAAGRRKETKRRSLELLRGCLICPLVDRAGPGEKGKVKTVHCCRSFVFFDQLLMRSLWLETLSNIRQIFQLQIYHFLLSKDQTAHHNVNDAAQFIQHFSLYQPNLTEPFDVDKN